MTAVKVRRRKLVMCPCGIRLSRHKAAEQSPDFYCPFTKKHPAGHPAGCSCVDCDASKMKALMYNR